MKEYTNPILPGFYPDPSICRVANDYYLVTSSFEYFPAIPVFHSRDLIHWEQLGHCLTRTSQLNLEGVKCSGGIWAPTIRWNEGKFYVTATNASAGENIIVSAANPEGPWLDPVTVDIGGIDPSLAFIDGRVYYTTNQSAPDGTPGFSQAEIDPDTGALLSDIRFIWTGTGGRAPEAPHLYRIGEWYYLMIAEGGTQFGHMENIARSKSAWGPFEVCPHNPILTSTNTRGWEVHCTGHGDLVQGADGKWWMVYLGIRISRKYMSHIGRETFLSRVEWDEDGWPVVNGGACPEILSYGELPSAFPVKEEPEEDTFDCEALGYHWNSLRGPAESFFSLKKRAGHLALFGNKHDISDIATPAFLGRRQRHFDCTIETLMDFSPQQDGEEAGLALLLSNEFYYKLCKRKDNNLDYLVLEKRAEDFRQVAAKIPLPKGYVRLHVKAEREMYHFYYALGNSKLIHIADASTRFLACEVAGRSFTGVYCGIFATGNGQDSCVPAYFDNFILKERDFSFSDSQTGR